MRKYRLNKEIKLYCKKFGIKKVKLTDEFSYYPNKALVTYTIYASETDIEFIELVNQKYNVNIRPWYFIFCLLHEIGHHMTLNQLSKEDFETDLILRSIIPFFENQGKAYLGFTAEDLATSWAIEYINSHLKECFEFQNKCIEIMKKQLTKVNK